MDKFALGSYSFVPLNSTISNHFALSEIETTSESDSIILFAGEHTSPLDNQMVHGAMEQGWGAAMQR
jgi:hypothetical protein